MTYPSLSSPRPKGLIELRLTPENALVCADRLILGATTVGSRILECIQTLISHQNEET